MSESRTIGEANRDRFYSELTALCKKYQLNIWDCGCCGARIVDEAEANTEEYGELFIPAERIGWHECRI